MTAPKMRSWISTDENPEFSLQNLPYGVFSTQDDPKHRIGVALGSYVLDLKVLARHQTFQELSFDSTSLEQETLNQFAGLGREVHRELRQFLQEILSTDASSREVLRDNDDLRRRAFVPLKDVEMHLPMQIGDYTDFFTSPYHAQNVSLPCFSSLLSFNTSSAEPPHSARKSSGLARNSPPASGGSRWVTTDGRRQSWSPEPLFVVRKASSYLRMGRRHLDRVRSWTLRSSSPPLLARALKWETRLAWTRPRSIYSASCC